jgi:NAD(P)H-dependent flavin oxidoreductase YrpB (nitropropane dioxygenase family)
MQSKVCELVGCEFPLFAFSHCRDVVAEVSKAGGFGVLGAVGHTPESLEIDLAWIDEHVDGHPYGVDLIVPTSLADKEGTLTPEELEARVPESHKRHVERILAENGIDTAGLWDREISAGTGDSMREKGASKQLAVALEHPIRMVVNALGVPPPFMIEAAREKGIVVGALTGSREHAVKHIEAGVDVLVVSGTEAGGHCGEISTLVVVPEVLDTIREFGSDTQVLAAGGIVTAEAETAPAVKEKMLAATSRQTVRSRSRTGKYTRQLRSPWTDAWQEKDSPDPLPMPLQGLVSGPALQRIDKLADAGDPNAKRLATYWVGQGVGLMNNPTSARSVVYEFMAEFAESCERLSAYTEE